MLTMKMYEYIRYAYYELGHNISEISTDSGKNWRTVKKAVEGAEPKYVREQPRIKPVMGPYVDVVREWLQKDKEEKRKKQSHTAVRVYRRLVEEYEFKGGESTVRDFVRQLKQEMGIERKEVFIPSDPEKRRGAEVDWGEAHVDIDGSRVKVYMFCMRARYSGKIFVKLFPTMLQECFFNGHIEAFAYFGGCFSEIVYDNLKTAVKKVLTGRGRIEQDAFVFFRAYYHFASLFCRVATGSDKGGVEGLVGYARRNYLTPIPQGPSLESINATLFENCLSRDLTTTHGQTKTIGELYLEESPWLQKMPETPYNNYRIIDTKVDRFLTVKIANNRYSAPHDYVGRSVSVELGLYDVRITCKNRVIAEHERDFRCGQWIIDPWHYLPVLCRKSRAYATSRISTMIEKRWNPAVAQMWKQQVEKYGEENGTKTFLQTLLYFKDLQYSDMIAVFELALETNVTSKESIFMLHQSLIEENSKREEAPIANIVAISDFQLPQPDMSRYDLLMEAENGKPNSRVVPATQP